MNLKLRLLVGMVVLALASAGATSAQRHAISLEDALAIAQRQFEGEDADYYRVVDHDDNCWSIFIDADPLAGWAHSCFIIKIPKVSESAVLPDSRIQKEEHSFPPGDRLEGLLVKRRYEIRMPMKSNVRRKSGFIGEDTAEEALTTAERTYVVILSGGGNLNSNSIRYWNDCSFIYQTMVNKYGISRDHIFPIMADGDNPAEDTSIGDSYISQNLDFDGDGIDDIELAATKENISNTLSHLSNVMRSGDHLFLYVTDHGHRARGDSLLNSNDIISSSTEGVKSAIILWDDNENKKIDRDEWLDPYELRDILNPLLDNSINVNVVMEQCYSGGFVTPLANNGCVVATACTASEKSYGFSSETPPYDVFVYYWTSAINGIDSDGNEIDADIDKDGSISMEEAFIYAKKRDVGIKNGTYYYKEHPQYSSSPTTLGEDLAFDHIPPAVNLYIKDNSEDKGRMPNISDSIFWTSPSIWVRNQADGISEHQNPVFSHNHTAKTVYVRVHNRGKDDYTGHDKLVRVHWAYASTAFMPQVWAGQEKRADGRATGGVLTPVAIPTVPAGGYRDVAIPWNISATDIPAVAESTSDSRHFSLLAEIVDSTHMSFRPALSDFDARKSSKTAQKSVTIISGDQLTKEMKTYVRNVKSCDENYTLELAARANDTCRFFNYADIDVLMSDETCSQNGSLTGNGDGGSLMLDATGYFEFPTESGLIHMLCLNPGHLGRLGLKFNFHSAPPQISTCTLDLIQRVKRTGDIVGGTTYVVKMPWEVGTIPVNPDPVIGGEIILEGETAENAHVRWEDSSHNVIGNTNSITVRRSLNGDQQYNVYSLTDDGVFASGSYTVEAANIIESAKIIGHGTLKVKLSADIPEGCSIVVVATSTGSILYNRPVKAGEADLLVDISSQPSDIIAVSALISDTEVQSVKVRKE